MLGIAFNSYESLYIHVYTIVYINNLFFKLYFALSCINLMEPWTYSSQLQQSPVGLYTIRGQVVWFARSEYGVGLEYAYRRREMC